MRLISVVLGTGRFKAREDASAALLNYGFTFYETVKLQGRRRGGAQARGVQGRRGTVTLVPAARRQRHHRSRLRGAAQDHGHGERAAGRAHQAGQALGELTVIDGKDVIARVPLVRARSSSRGRLVDAHGGQHRALVDGIGRANGRAAADLLSQR